MRLFYRNVRNLRSKLDSLRHFAVDPEYDILIFTETWLHSGMTNEELNLFNYSIFRSDRLTLAGGTLIAVHKDISCTLLKSTTDSFEGWFVELLLNDTSLVLGSIYIKSPSEYIVYSKACDFFDKKKCS